MDLFYEMPCLTERSSLLKGGDLLKRVFRKSDKRNQVQALQKFIDYNSRLFEFLGVQPFLLGSDQDSSLWFRSSSFIGAIPLRSPDTGKQIGDFVVAPRFVSSDRFSDYIEILDLLDADISPESVDSLALVSGRNFRPPYYLEAIKFIGTLEAIVAKGWRRFDTINSISNEPTGQINWSRYASREFMVENRTRFPTRRNLLSEFHDEYAQIRYVYDICRSELGSSRTPPKLRAKLRHRLDSLDQRLYFHVPRSTNQIHIRSADSPAVIACKQQGNRILNRILSDSTAWRVDFNDVFEKYVQYILRQVARELGGRLFPNYKLPIRSGKYLAWGLRNLEPDAILQKDPFIFMIEAKYKSHFLNLNEPTALLKDDFRRDLHQTLAYTSFGQTAATTGMIFYPYSRTEITMLTLTNPINGIRNLVALAGVPLQVEALSDSIEQVRDFVSEIVGNADSTS